MKPFTYIQLSFLIVISAWLTAGLYAEVQNAIPKKSPERLKPEFSEQELQESRLIIRKRQLVSELLDAIRFHHNRAIPGLIHRLENVAPGSAELYYFKALLQYRQKQKGQARVLVDKALSANAGYARAHNLKGLLFIESRQMKAGLRSFQRAWEHAPYNPTYAYNIASTQYRLGNMDEAEEMVAAALEAKLNLSEAYYLQALIQRHNKQSKLACQNFQKAQEFGQKSDKFYLEYLQTALDAKDREAQLGLLKLVSRMQNQEAYILAGETHFRFGEFKKAAYFFSMASKDLNATGKIRRRLVESLARSGLPAKRKILQMKIEDTEKKELLILFSKIKAEMSAEFEARDQILSPLR